MNLRRAHLPYRTALAGLTLASLLAACSRAPEAQPPNLVIVALDTLRPDHLGCYGYDRPTSPGLDRLAAESVVFEQAESPAPWTAPAMISLVTGLNPHAHGVYKFPNPGRLNERAVTLAEVLSDHGYRTGAFTEGGYAKGEFGLDQGFDVFPSNPGDAQTHMSNMLNPSRLEGNLDRALEWMASTDGEPFFVLFHTYEVHGPLRAPDEYVRRFDPHWDGDAEHDRLAAVASRWTTARKLDREGALLLRNHNFHCAPPPMPGVQQYMKQEGLLPEDGSAFYPETLQFLRDQYDAEIAYTDAVLERLWASLREQGLDENTIVVVVSDHGEALGEHGVVGHGSTHFREQLGIVFMIRAPGVASARINRPVSSVSLMPTVLELLDLPLEIAQAPSLVTLMREGPQRAQGPSLLYSQGLSVEGGEDRLVSGRMGNLRCILDTESGAAQIFDLEADPGETRDASADYPKRAPLLVDFVRREIDIDLNIRKVVAGEVDATELSVEMREELRHLGYIDGEEEDSEDE